MTTADADYAAAVAALRSQILPAYVEYVEEGHAHGIAGATESPVHVVVDVHGDRVISRSPSSGHDRSEMVGDSPVIRRLFKPECYVAKSERESSWNGAKAVAIAVISRCSDDNDDLFINTVYADARTGELVGAEGSETDEGMTVDLGISYARYSGFLVPSAITAHAHGHGMLFWARDEPR